MPAFSGSLLISLHTLIARIPNQGVWLIVFCFAALLSTGASAQQMTVTGTVQDTAIQKGLPYAVVVAVRLKDSLLTSYARTDMEGHFRLDSIPVDTYQVVVSHPLYGDHTVLLMGNPDEKEINLHNIALPPKSFQLNEVTVYGYADPVYYKGDTLFYTADSFQVKKNGVVEDLLKKLPGIKVDAQGKIYSQGKAVDQVLVDGDEFFGSDPTVATKNLSAASVESVAVYDKANENASDNSDKDVLKVMDLKLKDDAKKGYFGKLSSAHDYKDFYEDEVLLNKFKGKQKLSVFMLRSNTPRTSFGWNDMYEYGLGNDDFPYSENDDGSMNYYYDDNALNGIPRTFKTGAYFTDMLTPSTKVSLNYSYKNKQMDVESSTASQYFLPDTAYNTTEERKYHQETASHTANILINQKLDSLNELEITSRFVYSIPKQSNVEDNAFFTGEDTLTRKTITRNEDSGNRLESASSLKWTRTFANRDRKLTGQYRYKMGENENDGILQSINRYFNQATLPDDSINQEKRNNSDNNSQYFAIIYTEPLSKKAKIEFASDLLTGGGTQNKKTYDVVNGQPSTENPGFSNNFENTFETFRLGLKFIYEVKKQTFTLGARFRNMKSANHNLVSDERISQEVFKTLPSLTYRYKFSDNKTFSFRYSTDTKLPDLNQLQPVPDNTDPNYIVTGNPDLLPSFTHNFNTWMNAYKVVSGSYYFANAYLNINRNAFASDITYDSIGRTITRPVNVNGNYNAGLYSSGNVPLFSKWLKLEPSLNYSYSHATTFINSEENVTTVSNPTAHLSFTHETDSVEFSFGGGYSYYNSSSSLSEQSNQKYSSFDYSASFEMELPLKMRFETEATYSADRKRAEGYNLNVLLWNATLKKTFLKSDNLVLSLEAMDILNQSIHSQRNVQDNVISDVKSNVIGRYVLLKLMFKFNSNKSPEPDED